MAGYRYKSGQIVHGIDPLKGISLSPTSVPVYSGNAQNVPPEMRESKRDREIYKSDLPDHVYPFMPRTAQSLNLKSSITLDTDGPAPAGKFEIIRLQVPKSGGVIRLWKYALNTDVVNIEFRFLINNHNALPWHGNPQNDFRIDQSTGPDLTDVNLTDVQLLLQPNQILSVIGVSGGGGTYMRTRLVGYFDADQVRREDRFGG